jgi:hypothetical protein
VRSIHCHDYGVSQNWFKSGLRAPSHGPDGGVADSLDKAQAAFRAAWDALSDRNTGRRQQMDIFLVDSGASDPGG